MESPWSSPGGVVHFDALLTCILVVVQIGHLHGGAVTGALDRLVSRRWGGRGRLVVTERHERDCRPHLRTSCPGATEWAGCGHASHTQSCSRRHRRLLPCRSEELRRVRGICDGGALVVKIELIGNPNQLVERSGNLCGHRYGCGFQLGKWPWRVDAWHATTWRVSLVESTKDLHERMASLELPRHVVKGV